MKWENFDEEKWLVWKENAFHAVQEPLKDPQANRETLARAYVELSSHYAPAAVRVMWNTENRPPYNSQLPQIISEDGFLKMYALGMPLKVETVKRIQNNLEDFDQFIAQPLHVGWNDSENPFHDINATPPGLFSKLFRYSRLKKDRELLVLIAEDLENISHVEESAMRRMLTLAVLSHCAVYRELEGKILMIPSFFETQKLVPYLCTQHLIAEGVKTVSLIPQVIGNIPIYLCQGTELWPSQPSVLGSILANFAEHGSATQAYAHSWRRIHKHLRDLPGRPLVAGHSMGGALAMQIGLYSHNLVEEIYAFNPPMPNERDDQFYHQLSQESQDKIRVIANIDDFAFWKIGAKVIGKVTIFLSKARYKSYPVGIWDCIFLIPAAIKFILNVRHAFPSHQYIAALHENWVSFQLTPEEIEKENLERITRFDYLHFFPKLYDPLKMLLEYIRKLFRWRLEQAYLRNEIEILALHERDLIDTYSLETAEQLQHELQTLQSQKSALISRLNKK